MIEAGRGSAQRGDSPLVTRSVIGEAMRHRDGCAPYERRFGFARHVCTGSDAPAARAFSRRGLWRRDRRATRRCDTDFRSVGDTAAEWEAFRGESALSGLGRDDACRQRTLGDVRCGRARTDAEVSLSMFALFCHAYHLTMRWSEQRAALRSTLEMTTTFSLRATRHPARCRSSCSR